jgi:hypothetical protein
MEEKGIIFFMPAEVCGANLTGIVLGIIRINFENYFLSAQDRGERDDLFFEVNGK